MYVQDIIKASMRPRVFPAEDGQLPGFTTGRLA